MYVITLYVLDIRITTSLRCHHTPIAVLHRCPPPLSSTEPENKMYNQHPYIHITMHPSHPQLVQFPASVQNPSTQSVVRHLPAALSSSFLPFLPSPVPASGRNPHWTNESNVSASVSSGVLKLMPSSLTIFRFEH